MYICSFGIKKKSILRFCKKFVRFTAVRLVVRPTLSLCLIFIYFFSPFLDACADSSAVQSGQFRVLFSLFGKKETFSNTSPINEAIIFHNHIDLTLLSLSKLLQQWKKERIFLYVGGEEWGPVWCWSSIFFGKSIQRHQVN